LKNVLCLDYKDFLPLFTFFIRLVLFFSLSAFSRSYGSVQILPVDVNAHYAYNAVVRKTSNEIPRIRETIVGRRVDI
jgi:hypothetical protein